MLSNNLQSRLDRRGRAATLQYKSSGTYDHTAGSLGSVTSTEVTVKMYFADYNLSEVNNDSILLGDRKVVVATKDLTGVAVPEPDVGDYITSVGDTAVIKSVQKLYNSNTLVCYICQARE